MAAILNLKWKQRCRAALVYVVSSISETGVVENVRVDFLNHVCHLFQFKSYFNFLFSVVAALHSRCYPIRVMLGV